MATDDAGYIRVLSDSPVAAAPMDQQPRRECRRQREESRREIELLAILNSSLELSSRILFFLLHSRKGSLQLALEWALGSLQFSVGRRYRIG